MIVSQSEVQNIEFHTSFLGYMFGFWFEFQIHMRLSMRSMLRKLPFVRLQ